jgi:hypothetical protein
MLDFSTILNQGRMVLMESEGKNAVIENYCHIFYRLDRMKGAAIADPETGSSPGNLLTAMHSGSSANCSSQEI